MKKQQAVNLWRELHDTTEKEAVYRKFDNKSGYAGKRTLIRYSQVDEGLQQAWSLPELADRIGWSKPYLNKLVAWWQEEFGGDPLIHQGKGSISPLEARSAIAPSEAAERRRKHQELLLATLDTLIGIEPLPMDHTDQMYFYIRPLQTNWPIPKGRIWRNASGQFAVHLRCEHDCQRSCQENDVAWTCLCQHLEDHPLGSAIIGLKAILARDISDRLQLFAAIEGRASRPREEGGTGLRLNPEMTYNSDVSGSGYGPYYLLTILHQSLSRRLKSPLSPKIKEEFKLEAFGIIQLGSYPVIQAYDPTEWDRAVDWLLEMQDKAADWPKTQAAGESYSRAMAACRNVQRYMDLLQLQGGLPEGSRCDGCRSWSGN